MANNLERSGEPAGKQRGSYNRYLACEDPSGATPKTTKWRARKRARLDNTEDSSMSLSVTQQSQSEDDQSDHMLRNANIDDHDAALVDVKTTSVDTILINETRSQ